MPRPKVPEELKGGVRMTGYGYQSVDGMYRIFRYKYKEDYRVNIPERWKLLMPDGTDEHFNTLMEARWRIYHHQQEFYKRVEEVEKRKEKETRKQRKETKGKT